MKSVLISIQPYWVFLIIARFMGWNIPQEKTIEVRKDFPKASDWNKVVHIYCSKNRKSFNRIPKEYQPLMEKLLGKVMGEFVCGGTFEILGGLNDKLVLDGACLTEEEAGDYLGRVQDTPMSRTIYGIKKGYGWHISDFKIYDKPKELGEFITVCKTYYSDNDDKCWGCPNLRVIDGNKEAYQGNCISRHKPLTRPPQSWFYIEE